MGNYRLDLPPVLDADNRPMTVEEAEASLKEPEVVRFELTRGDSVRKYVVLCDLNNVDGDAMDEFDVFKNRQYAVIHESNRSKSFRVGRKVEEEEGEHSQGISGEQAIKLAKMKPEERKIFLALLFPPDWEENPIVLASNLPDMPRENAQIKAWFERGGPIAQEVMEAIVMAIDPTGPLAQNSKRQREVELMEAKMMATMQEQLENLQKLSTSNAPSSTPSATASAPSESNSTAADEALSEEEALEEAFQLETERLEAETASLSTPNENGGSPSDAAGATASADEDSS